MATVEKNKTAAQAQKKDGKLPKPPKGWMEKRLDNLKRALRAITTLNERFTPAVPMEKRPEWSPKVNHAAQLIQSLHATGAEALKAFAGLQAGNYEPVGAAKNIKLANGMNVWVRPSVWANKYRGLYKPEELDGLKIVSINGKKALAKSDSGTTVVEPTGSFSTKPVEYAEAQ